MKFFKIGADFWDFEVMSRIQIVDPVIFEFKRSQCEFFRWFPNQHFRRSESLRYELSSGCAAATLNSQNAQDKWSALWTKRQRKMCLQNEATNEMMKKYYENINRTIVNNQNVNAHHHHHHYCCPQCRRQHSVSSSPVGIVLIFVIPRHSRLLKQQKSL